MTLKEFLDTNWHRGNVVRLKKGKEYLVKGIKGHGRWLLLYSEEFDAKFVADYRIVDCRTSDYAQNALGNVVYVDMPEVDDEVEASEDFGAVESVKAASDLISPVTGTVVEVNEELEDAPELLNKDPYENWIIKVEMSDPTELDNLMDAAAYEEMCKNEA